MPVEELDKTSFVSEGLKSVHLSQCLDDNEAVDAINRSFDTLITERIYPWVITKFAYFDKHFMMPIFKRKHKKVKKKKRKSSRKGFDGISSKWTESKKNHIHE